MLKESSRSLGGNGGGRVRMCDFCASSACKVYCEADSAYLCTNCDARVHAANRVASRHSRVLICEACENAPAAFTCKADAAALCKTCDTEIHSANPLARRHHRVPVLPMHGCLCGNPSSNVFKSSSEERTTNLENGLQFDPKMIKEKEEEIQVEEDETSSWLLLNPVKNDDNNNNNNNNNKNNNRNGFLFGEEADEYLDLVEYHNNNPCTDSHNQYFDDQYDQKQENRFEDQENDNGMSDGVVPVNEHSHHHQQQNFQLEMDYEASKAGFTNIHSVSISSMDGSIVPDFYHGRYLKLPN